MGFLKIIDLDVLLPGNVIRHVAGHSQIGNFKAQAVQDVMKYHAPWTEIIGLQNSPPPRTPSELRKCIEDFDVVIDTTGSESLIGSLATLSQNMKKPFVSGALSRGGFIARVQRQALPSDIPLYERTDPRYPIIPAGDDNEEFAVPQMSCSADKVLAVSLSNLARLFGIIAVES